MVCRLLRRRVEVGGSGGLALQHRVTVRSEPGGVSLCRWADCLRWPSLDGLVMCAGASVLALLHGFLPGMSAVGGSIVFAGRVLVSFMLFGCCTRVAGPARHRQPARPPGFGSLVELACAARPPLPGRSSGPPVPVGHRGHALGGLARPAWLPCPRRVVRTVRLLRALRVAAVSASCRSSCSSPVCAPLGCLAHTTRPLRSLDRPVQADRLRRIPSTPTNSVRFDWPHPDRSVARPMPVHWSALSDNPPPVPVCAGQPGLPRPLPPAEAFPHRRRPAF